MTTTDVDGGPGRRYGFVTMASELTTLPPDELATLLPVLDRVVAGTPLPA